MEKLSKEFKASGEPLIKIECGISKGDEKCLIFRNPITVVALWDTGASYCYISPSVAKRLGLVAKGKDSFITKDGRFTNKNLYIVNLHLTTRWIEPVVAFESDCETHQLLIGMDLITRGNFIIKNTTTGFLFSFESSNQ